MFCSCLKVLNKIILEIMFVMDFWDILSKSHIITYDPCVDLHIIYVTFQIGRNNVDVVEEKAMVKNMCSSYRGNDEWYLCLSSD